MEKITSLLANFGFGEPLTRAIVGFLAASIGEFIFKPSFSFTLDGRAKTIKETYATWYIVALAIALLFSAF
jgi:hypothetical protein